MKDPIENFWDVRLEAVKDNLIKNHFETFIAKTALEAKEMALDDIIPKIAPTSVSWGGSVSFVQTGLFHELSKRDDIRIINTFDQNISTEASMERRRQSLLTDLYITGTNAVTESGQLVNLDMIGNRTAAIMWGPKNVLLIIGRNKICKDIEDARARIKGFAAPVNTMRLDKKTPCVKTGVCHDCNSPDRICNYWMIAEKCFPEGRIKIILVNETLGF